MTDPRLTRGVEAFNAGDFFGAHEIWEDLWVETVGPEKLLVQGLVQVAAGYAKVETGVRAGAIKLLTRGSALLRQYDATAFGLALAPFVDAVEQDLERLRTMAPDAVSLDCVHAPNLRLV